MVKAIIFDFFGVVGLSTYAMLAEKYKYTEQQHDQLWDLHRALDAGFVSQDEFLKTYADIIGISKKELVQSFDEVEARMGINQPVLDFAQDLRKDYKVGLLSNVSVDAYRFIEPILPNFDEVVASYMYKVSKPEIAIFEIMANRLGVDLSDCVMIDDSQLNCDGAVASGMQSILYNNLNQLKTDLTQLLSDSDN